MFASTGKLPNMTRKWYGRKLGRSVVNSSELAMVRTPTCLDLSTLRGNERGVPCAPYVCVVEYTFRLVKNKCVLRPSC
ncbi:hypothetical protein BN14_04166 [Rhizoctonia solani AG-1 IB]|uniref:Uncharacterized protein n=2 Tax=Rhizoctonia solani TaxID=456999 RepID=A0A8H2WDJ8_9AGAM|nr:unnamed protein product [Rhizoctonia solani]CCO30142.1 hypothetical protein BN14_04166 [Rhizoctonia solani AG-1 IB]